MKHKNREILSVVEEGSTEIRELCLRFKVSRLDLFGSAVTAEFKKGESDLDFLVEFLPAATVNYADNYFGLLEALAKLFDTPVDLVVGTSIRNPYFLQSIEAAKRLVYAA